MEVENLKRKYEERKDEIKKRLQEFKSVLNESDERIFAELAFCLCTPQSKATTCWKAVASLVNNNFLYSGSESDIRPFLNSVRFGDNKSKWIVEAREKFTSDNKIQIKNLLNNFSDEVKLREWLVENIKGLGMKESSHFLRNIGLGDNLAILDRHILKNLVEYGAIKEIPKNLNKKNYLEIEKKMKEFANEIGIPFDELDLLFWSEETGIIFK